MNRDIHVNDIVLCRLDSIFKSETYIRVTGILNERISGKILTEEVEYDLRKPLFMQDISAVFPSFRISAQQIRDVITGKILLDDLDQPYPCWCFEWDQTIVVHPEEILAGLQNVMTGHHEDLLLEYMQFLSYGKDRMYKLIDEKQANQGIRFLPSAIFLVDGMIDELDLHPFDDINDYVMELYDSFEPDCPVSIREQAEQLRDVLQDTVDELAVPVENRHYDSEDLDLFLHQYLDPSMAEDATEEELIFARNLIEDLIGQEDPLAMTVKARACGGGSRLYECDWYEARELFHEAFEINHSPIVAMDLGMLCINGRTTNGVPQLDQAFFYFTLADHAGFIEASLQLCELYLNEKSVVYNPMIAYDKAAKACEETREMFLEGNRYSFYPEAMMQRALSILAVPSGMSDTYLAASWMMTALFGQHLRNLTSEDIENDMAVIRATHMLENLFEKAGKKGMAHRIYDSLEDLLAVVTVSRAVLNLEGKQNRNGSWKITVKHRSHDGELHRKRFFQALPEYSFTGFTDKLIIRGDDSLSVTIDGKEVSSFHVIADEVREGVLYYGGREMLAVNGELKIGKPEYPKNRCHLMADVVNEMHGTHLECICDSTSICAGDQVDILVDRVALDKGVVEAVYRMEDLQLHCPPSQLLQVRKTTDDFTEESITPTLKSRGL